MVPKECGFLDLACGMTPNGASESDWRRLVLDAGFGDVVSLGYDDPIAARATVIGRKPAAMQRSSIPREVDPATWLILADDFAADPAAAVIRALAPFGQRVVIAQSGSRFDRLGLDRFDVPPADSNSYAELFRLLAADGVDRLHLVHLRERRPAQRQRARLLPGPEDHPQPRPADGAHGAHLERAELHRRQAG